MDTLLAMSRPITVSTPTITVVVPLFNGEKYIEHALRSVAAQTISPHEIIVVDTGSSDQGSDIVDLLSDCTAVRLVRMPHGDRSSARNVGVSHATGSLIALLDLDDIWYPDHLQELVRPLQDNPALRIGWIYSDVDEVNENGQLVARSVLSRSGAPHPKTELLSCIGQDMLVLPSASLIAKAAFDAVGGFDESLAGYEDDDLFLRLFLAGYQNIYVEKPLSQRRAYPLGSPASSRMAHARMTYAKKLADTFPDDHFRNRFYTRDVIVPRFVEQVKGTLRGALRAGETSLAETCRQHIETLQQMAGAGGRVSACPSEPVVTAIVLLEDGETAIESVLRTVFSQRRAADEVIVVDNGSRDRGPVLVAALAERWPMRLVSIPRGSSAKAWNAAVAHAHGDLIAFLRDDGMWHPDLLGALIASFKTDPGGNTAISQCAVGDFYDPANPPSESYPQEKTRGHDNSSGYRPTHYEFLIIPSSLIVARSAFDAIGGFDENLLAFETDDLFTRLIHAGYHNAFVDQVLVRRRLEYSDPRSPVDVANARMAFLRKLLQTTHADPRALRPVLRRQIIPRFQENAAKTLKQALRDRDMPLADLSVQEIELLKGFAEPSDQVDDVGREHLVSVVIPLYNGAATIAEALHSVFQQIRPPDEVIVVDDGSTDDGPALVSRLAEKYPIRLLTKANGGQSSARNFGVRHAHGDLIALLDQDDAWYAQHLAELVRPFEEAQPKPIGWTYSNLDEVDRAGALISAGVLNHTGTEHPKTNLVDALRRDMFILPSATVLSRAAFEAVGGFDERLMGYEDDDLFIRLLQAGYDNVYIPKPLSRWRVFSESASFSPRMARSRMIFARKLLELFPDNPTRNTFYARDLLVPRFQHHVAENLRRALLNSDYALADRCAADLLELGDCITSRKQFLSPRNNLLLSVIVPAQGEDGAVQAALRSVLAQRLRPDEVIVVTSGTDVVSDALQDMCEMDPRVRILNAPQGGILSAQNFAARHAYGDVLAFLHPGHEWYPDYLSDLRPLFQEPSAHRLGWVFADYDETDVSGRLTAQSVMLRAGALRTRTTIEDCIQETPLTEVSASLISRKAFLAVGGFDDQLSAHATSDLFVRLLQAGYDNAPVARALARRPAADARPPCFAPSTSARRFAQKLISTLPETSRERDTGARQRVVATLVQDVLAEARIALHVHDDPSIERCLSDLAWFDPILTDDRVAPLPCRPLLISVIIPLYNGAEYINDAIDSVLAQTLVPDEIIIVDDGSIDAGPEIIAKRAETAAIRIIRRPNGGQSAARNTGVEYAHGDLIAFLDQDDVWYPDHLEELVKPFRSPEPNQLGWSYSDLDEIDENGDMVCRGVIRSHHRTAHPKLDLVNCLRQDMFILPSATLISRAAFLKIGGFNERLSGYEDDDLFLRLFRGGFQCAFLPRSLSKWRIYQRSSSFSPRMAISRLAYARLLIERFPDDPTRSLYFVRDLIAPRFLRSMSVDFRRCVLTGNRQQQKVTLDHLAFIVRHLRLTWRLPLQYVVVPALRIPIVARIIAPRRLPVMRLFRNPG